MKLSEIIQELKAPKNQKNSFGNYKYRSCEDILEAIKPLLKGCMLNLSDEVVLIGTRYYVKATATFNDGSNKYESIAYAREPEEKRGMDSSQITGTASSYARKYALNGLFCIDDTKDADTDEHHKQTNKGMPEQKLPEEDINGEPINRDLAKSSYNECVSKIDDYINGVEKQEWDNFVSKCRLTAKNDRWSQGNIIYFKDKIEAKEKELGFKEE